MHTHDPLHVPAACRQDDMDYQWFSIYGVRDPEATGWQEVPRSAMPEEYTESSTSIDRREMRLYWRPLATSVRTRAQETAVAQASLDNLVRLSAVPLTSPMGANPGKRTLRGLTVFSLVWLLHRCGLPPSRWLVAVFARTTEVGLSRWAEENRVTLDRYVALHTRAILEGRGRWPGQIVRGEGR